MRLSLFRVKKKVPSHPKTLMWNNTNKFVLAAPKDQAVREQVPN